MANATQKKAKDTREQESHQFSAEISKVLKLMIHSLYTNKDIFLRELISNASDACDKLRYAALTNQALLDGQPELNITVSHDEKASTITVEDTGIGMNREDLINNLGTIAKSGTEEFFANLSGDASKDVSLIGQFGVGFYASFMIADKVEVRSRKAGEAQGWIWESAGDGTFTVVESSDTLPRGTSITLHVRKDAAQYLDTFKLRHIIETYSDHISFPIYQRPVTYQGQGEPELVNEGGALWAKPKAEITPEQYQEFFRHVAHQAGEPWLTLHNTVEGKASYTNLLFIPSTKPFDLFHPERRRRVKLYVKRVFITDENIDLVPHYLRFLRGIIDSSDLPLNISRETLQDNPQLRQIRESITSKVLSELSKKASKQEDAYHHFWDLFGAVLKEGLCESDSPKEKILDVCRFATTHGEKLTSLKAYLERKPEAQQHIFYMTADALEAAKNSPLLDGFKKRGIEVLLLTDHVDDFWVNVVQKYQDVPFKSITRSDIDLDAIVQLKKEAKDDNKAADSSALDDEKQHALLQAIHNCFDEGVKEVRPTTKLVDALACLAVEEGGMEMRMERFLMDHKQLPRRAAKILEVNVQHPFFAHMASIMEDDSAKEEFTECAKLLLDQAMIIEGEAPADQSGFAKRLSMLINKAFL
jgi:molecular chaperone HtpG